MYIHIIPPEKHKSHITTPNASHGSKICFCDFCKMLEDLDGTFFLANAPRGPEGVEFKGSRCELWTRKILASKSLSILAWKFGNRLEYTVST